LNAVAVRVAAAAAAATAAAAAAAAAAVSTPTIVTNTNHKFHKPSSDFGSGEQHFCNVIHIVQLFHLIVVIFFVQVLRDWKTVVNAFSCRVDNAQNTPQSTGHPIRFMQHLTSFFGRLAHIDLTQQLIQFAIIRDDDFFGPQINGLVHVTAAMAQYTVDHGTQFTIQHGVQYFCHAINF
jgi:hypothetical protein